jgi:DNA-binding response OmpR family regulator
MPDLTGYELIERVQNHIPIVALTAHTDPKEMQKIADAGFDDCLVKPVPFETMILSIHSILDREKITMASADVPLDL